MAWKFFSAAGAEKRAPATVQGSQLDYAQITSDVSVGAGNTNEGNALAVVTGNSITYDGSKVKIEFSCENLLNGGHQPTLGIFKDGVCIADFGPYNSASAFPVKLEIFDTPSAGNHTYAVKIWDTGATAGGVVKAGAGGAGAVAPAFIRVTRADPQVVVQYVGVPGSLIGQEVAEQDLTTLTNITATSEATAQTFATITFTADGTSTYLLDAEWYGSKGTSFINFALYKDGTDQGVIFATNGTSLDPGSINPHRWSHRVTPASGSHTWTLRAWVDAGTGTAGGGAGGAGVALPGYFRAVRAA